MFGLKTVNISKTSAKEMEEITALLIEKKLNRAKKEIDFGFSLFCLAIV
jgi:hypothetical protein